MASSPEKKRSNPWVMRTYSGHSTAKASNELYRMNLAKGQSGLSIAFDLPTQPGYDPDDPRATGEVGKVGSAHAAAASVPLRHRRAPRHRAALGGKLPVVRAAV